MEATNPFKKNILMVNITTEGDSGDTPTLFGISRPPNCVPDAHLCPAMHPLLDYDYQSADCIVMLHGYRREVGRFTLQMYPVNLRNSASRHLVRDSGGYFPPLLSGREHHGTL